jgi:hypothetical protein
MKTIMLFSLFCGLLLVCGCFDWDSAFDIKLPLSLYPLYTDEDIIFDANLPRILQDKDVRFEFREDKENKGYTLLFSEKGQQSKFSIHLLKIGDVRCCDISPDVIDPNSVEPSLALMCIPGHLFCKVESITPEIKFRWVNLVDADPNVIRRETLKNCILFTTPTKQLQDYILKNIDNEDIFSEIQDLTPPESNINDADKCDDPNERKQDKNNKKRGTK